MNNMSKLPLRAKEPQPSTANINKADGSAYILATWSRAVEIFNTELTHDVSKQIQALPDEHKTFSDLRKAALEAQDSPLNATSKWSSRTQSFIKGVLAYKPLGDALVGFAPYSNYITLAMNGFAYLLQFTLEDSKTADSLADDLQTIFEIVARAEQYAWLYTAHWSDDTKSVFANLQDHLVHLYAQCLNLLIRATVFFKTGKLKRHLSSGFKPYQKRFAPILDRIKELDENVRKDTDVLRLEIELKNEEFSNGMWLDAVDISDTTAHLSRGLAPDAGDWFVQHPEFTAWYEHKPGSFQQSNLHQKFFQDIAAQAEPIQVEESHIESTQIGNAQVSSPQQSIPQQVDSQQELLRPSCLWIQGRLGCGKSTLALKIAEKLQHADKPVSSVFCNHNTASQSSINGILRNCIFQAVKASKDPKACHAIIQKVRLIVQAPAERSNEPLWTILESLFQLDGDLFVIVDGLVESNGSAEDKTLFVERLGDLVDQHHERVSLIILSRTPCPVENKLKKWAKLEILPTDIQADMQAFIQISSKNSIVLRNHSRKEELSARLLQNADGNFVWTKLVIEGFDKNRWNVDQVLQKPPQGLVDIYQIILRDIASDREAFKTIHGALSLTYISAVPLSTKDFVIALAVQQGLRDWKEYEDIGDLTKDTREFERLCAPLLVITPMKHVMFCHSSFKAFLSEISNDTWHAVTGLVAAKPFEEPVLHRSMASLIIQYMSFDIFNEDLDEYLVEDVEEGLGVQNDKQHIAITIPANATPSIDSKVERKRRIQLQDLPREVLLKVSREVWHEEGLNRLLPNTIPSRRYHYPFVDYATRYMLYHFVRSVPDRPLAEQLEVFFTLPQGWFWLRRLQMNFRMDDDDLDVETHLLNVLLAGAKEALPLTRKDFRCRIKEDRLAYAIKEDLGPDVIGQLRHTLSHTYRNMGNYEAAEKMTRENVSFARKSLQGLPDTYMEIGSLAMDCQHLGRLVEARILAEEAVTGLENLLGPSNPETIKNKCNQALLLLELGDLKGAEKAARTVVQVAREQLSEKHPSTHHALKILAGVLEDIEQLDEAESLWRHVYDLVKERDGAESTEALSVLDELANNLKMKGDYNSALEIRKNTNGTLTSLLGPAHSRVLKGQCELAFIYQRLSDFTEASQIMTKAIEVSEDINGRLHDTTLYLMSRYAEFWFLETRAPYHIRTLQAFSITVMLIKIYGEKLGLKNLKRIKRVEDIVVLLVDHCQYESASRLAWPVAMAYHEMLGHTNEQTIKAIERVAELKYVRGKLSDAQELVKLCMSLRKTQSGEIIDSPSAKQSNLARLWYEICYLERTDITQDENNEPDLGEVAQNRSDQGASLPTKSIKGDPKSLSDSLISNDNSLLSNPYNTSSYPRSLKLSDSGAFVLPNYGVWRITRQKRQEQNQVIPVLNFKFEGFEEIPETGLEAGFDESFTLKEDAFPDLKDGIYEASPTDDGVQWKRCFIPHEKALVALCLGKDMTPFGDVFDSYSFATEEKDRNYIQLWSVPVVKEDWDR